MVAAPDHRSTLSELYGRWERQHWNAQGIDLAVDRRDWLNLTDHQRWQWYWLANFANFRRSETDAVIGLAQLLPYLPRPEQQQVLATQIADESRHAFFFERFHDEVLSKALPSQEQGPVTPSPAFQCLFVDSSRAAVQKAIAEPGPANLAAAVVHVFIVLEGAVALASFTVMRKLLIKTELFPGLLEGMTNAHRDEVRHAQFGIALLQDIFRQDPSSRGVVTTYLEQLLPKFSELLLPRPERKAILESLGLNPLERRQRAFGLLRRHLDALDIDAGFVEPWAPAPPSYETRVSQSYDFDSA